jgi:hypothetical protein
MLCPVHGWGLALPESQGVKIMSVKIMRMVWNLEMDQKDKLVLLAYADCADHDGGSIHPAVVTIAKRTGYSERSIQRHTRLLEKHGWLISDGYGAGQGNTNRWHMPLVDGAILSAFAEIKADTDGTFSESEKMTPGEEKMTPVAEKVTPMTLKGDTAVSSESSLTVIKPSANARAFAAQKIKMLPQKAQRGETAELQRARSPNVWLSDHEPPPPAASGNLASPPTSRNCFCFVPRNKSPTASPYPACFVFARPNIFWVQG